MITLLRQAFVEMSLWSWQSAYACLYALALFLAHSESVFEAVFFPGYPQQLPLLCRALSGQVRDIQTFATEKQTGGLGIELLAPLETTWANQKRSTLPNVAESRADPTHQNLLSSAVVVMELDVEARHHEAIEER